MPTTEKANELARKWIADWNAHDLDRIISHYSSDIVFSSPFVKRIGGSASGALRGRPALLQYFRAALDRFPSLNFQLHAVLVGVETITILYQSVNGLLAAETMELDGTGQITRVWAQYDKLE